MALSSFFDTFTFADEEAQDKFFDELEKATLNPPERIESRLKYSNENEEEGLAYLRSRFNLSKI